MSRWSLAASARPAADTLAADLGGRFGTRLTSLVAYGRWIDPEARPRGAASRPGLDAPLHTMALVANLSFDDLASCADRAEAWEAMGLATPLLLTRDEFLSSLDTFPVEFGDILDRHLVLVGIDPFDGAQVRAEDLRRACEIQAKSHLIHLREGFLESGGRAMDVEQLIAGSIASFGTLLGNLARLHGSEDDTADALARFAEVHFHVSSALVRRLLSIAEPIPPDEALQLYPPYHDAIASIASQVDRWKGPSGA